MVEFNSLYTTGASIPKSEIYTGGTSGLSSPDQLVNLTASVSVVLDNSAAGNALIFFTNPSTPNRATRLAQIRLNNFEKLGDAWRALADL
jgi:hypothetical protein